MRACSQRFGEMLNPMETIKIRIYIHILLADNPLNLGRELQLISELESGMNSSMYDDNYAGFFLSTLDYYLHCHNKPVFYMHETKLGSLKAKFLDLLIALDQHDIKPENIPLMLNIAIRTGKICPAPIDLPFVGEFEVQKVPSLLISELKSNFLEDYSIWQEYFIKSVNCKFEIQHSVTPANPLKKTLGVLATPFTLFSKKASKLSDMQKQVNNRKDYYKSSMSEISMILCSVRLDTSKAAPILKKLGETFDIDTSSVEHIYQIFKSINAERVEKEAFKTVWTKRSELLHLHETVLGNKSTTSSRQLEVILSPIVLSYLDGGSILPLMTLSGRTATNSATKLKLYYAMMNSYTRSDTDCYKKSTIYMQIIMMKIQRSAKLTAILDPYKSRGNRLYEYEDCKLSKYSKGLLENDAKRTSKSPQTIDVGLPRSN
jgi:hypothetical protein